MRKKERERRRERKKERKRGRESSKARLYYMCMDRDLQLCVIIIYFLRKSHLPFYWRDYVTHHFCECNVVENTCNSVRLSFYAFRWRNCAEEKRDCGCTLAVSSLIQ